MYLLTFKHQIGCGLQGSHVQWTAQAYCEARVVCGRVRRRLPQLVELLLEIGGATMFINIVNSSGTLVCKSDTAAEQTLTKKN